MDNPDSRPTSEKKMSIETVVTATERERRSVNRR
jgi:hypothetical protein